MNKKIAKIVEEINLKQQRGVEENASVIKNLYRDEVLRQRKIVNEMEESFKLNLDRMLQSNDLTRECIVEDLNYLIELHFIKELLKISEERYIELFGDTLDIVDEVVEKQLNNL
jgi:hypothetical protein